jgi:carboxyl-terminal processing protease
MDRSRLTFLLISVSCLLLVVFSSLSRASGEQEDENSLSKQLSVFSEVLHLIRRAYVEETPVDQLLLGALDGTTDALDPLSTFIPADQVASFELVKQVGPYRSGLSVVKERGIAYVVAVEKGSAGDEAGVLRGDILSTLAGRSTRRMPLWQIQKILADDPGTEISIEILRRGQTEEAALTLRDVEARPAEVEDRDGIPVLRIPRFEASTAEAVRATLQGLDQAGRHELVIDLRGVAGGDSAAAYSVAGLFVNGHLGELAVKGGEKVSFEAMEDPIWSGSSVVLIDSGSLGPAEILASVLQQGAESRLVGEHSFGLAGRQAMHPLSDGSRLLLTDAFYTGPDNEPIDESLAPDLSINNESRRFADRDLSLDELILERGLELLLEDREKADRDVA